ncbi:unnamed protein product [Leuciscus chuanchicus]
MGVKSPDTKFRAPGPMHQARWMAKAIYSIKVWLFRSLFKLTARESRGLLRLNIFLAKIYIKFWFQAPVAATAPRNDLQLLQSLHSYPDRDISTDTSRKIAGHLWYLSENLILLSLFDKQVDFTTKRAILKALEEWVGEKAPPKRVQVDMLTIKQKTLDNFVSKSSRNLFSMLGIPDAFLSEDPESWNSRDDFKAAEAIINSLVVTNDHAECGVALIQDASQSGRFRCEEQLPYALNSVSLTDVIVLIGIFSQGGIAVTSGRFHAKSAQFAEDSKQTQWMKAESGEEEFESEEGEELAMEEEEQANKEEEFKSEEE